MSQKPSRLLLWICCLSLALNFLSGVFYVFPRLRRSLLIWIRSISFQHEEKVLRCEGRYSNYLIDVLVNPVAVLPPPTFQFPRTPGEVTVELKPEISVQAIDPGSERIVFYFEFDVVDSFDSPNLLRHPVLMPLVLADDLTSPQGLWLQLFQSQQRVDVGGGPNLRFPFRASALRLPERREKLTPREFERQAMVLGWGLQGRALVREVFSYVRSIYLWSSDTYHVPSWEVFRRGLGECGHINDLLGRFLELNGIRYRTVSGYCPRVKPVYPGGGHSAIEVLLNGKWEYVDPYFDVYAEGISAREIGEMDLGPKILIFSVAPGFDHKVFGEAVYLQDLFDFRTYKDKPGRSKDQPMTELDAEEKSYGLDWALDKPAKLWTVKELLPPRIRVYVRCRYAMGKDVAVAPLGQPFTPPRYFRFSEWANTYFEVDTSTLKQLSPGRP